MLCWRHYQAPAAALLWTITPLPPPPILSQFFPNFKCLWRPPRLVRFPSPSGYILPRPPPQLRTGLGFLFSFKVSFEKHLNDHGKENADLAETRLLYDVAGFIGRIFLNSTSRNSVQVRAICMERPNIRIHDEHVWTRAERKIVHQSTRASSDSSERLRRL